jgi:lipopolysaccharide/colanic/teichoic acid biosynthesis glycosyltransferase
MRIWPVVLDSQPSYLQGRGRSSSLLLAPLGTSVLIEQLTATLRSVTDNPPLIVSSDAADARLGEWIAALTPKAQVATTSSAFAQSLASHELSDALLFVDPRCLPIIGYQFSELIRHQALDPRVAHHLVAFERASSGTKERVCLDATGQVRAIQRHYENATWSSISGIAATLVPCACSDVTEGQPPRSLAELRELLNSHGVPSRDVAIEGGAFDLREERGMLAANEQLLLAAATVRPDGDAAVLPIYVGRGHQIHPTARVMGPVVIHPDAVLESNATVLGPAVVGTGARIGANAVIAHTTVGPDCVVAPNAVVRDRAWFRHVGDAAFDNTERAPISYGERLARVTMDTHEPVPVPHQPAPVSDRGSLALKRSLDMTASALGLLICSPVLILVAIAVWVESRGPIFYGDEREGRFGRVFKCWKFRTMYTGAHLAQRELKALDHTDGPHFKVDRDPRVTRVGRVLRTLNLDELPQLWNVLTGEMSLVGPRPSPFRENQVCIPWRTARLAVRPGITGLWQVCRHNRSAGDFHQWIEYDLLYVQNLSFWLDVKILVATFGTLGGKVLHVPSSWLIKDQPVPDEHPLVEDVPQPTHHEAERVA